jgi:hypothetical protein
MRRVFLWLQSHPLTTASICFIALCTSLHFYLNWKAEQRWQAYAAESRARGVKLTLAEFTPPEIPDAENFAALPMMRTTMDRNAKPAFQIPRVRSGPRPANNYSKGERLDLKAWAKFFHEAGFIPETTDSAQRDVLLALDHYAAEIKEWSGWRTRPRCQFPTRLDATGFLQTPNFTTFTNASQVFALRMHAHLAAGDPAAALADFEDAFQACRALENPQTLISGVLQAGLTAMTCGQVGESLAAQSWTESELRRIDSAFATLRPALAFRQSFSAERVYGNSYYDRLVRSRETRRDLVQMAGGSVPPWAYEFIPRRVFRDNQLRQNQFLDEVLAKVGSDEFPLDPDKPLPSGPESLQDPLDEYYFFLFKLFGGVVPTVEKQSISLKTRIDQTRLAIALERFRLLRGAFPERLDPLVPEFIESVPVETYSRQPMLYRRNEGGTFLLYGVGKNRIDDGGVRGAKGNDGELLDDVWFHAPPAR